MSKQDQFETIQPTQLDTVNGGGWLGTAVKFAWKRVIKPILPSLGFEVGAEVIRQQNQPPPPPPPAPPAR